MINTRIAYRNSEGGVSIVCPSPEFCANPESTMAKLLSRSVPEGAIFEELKAEDIPVDRYFRNAWRLNGGIHTDMDCARGIHLNCLRKVRNEKLLELDVTFQRALESKDVAAQDSIAAKKQALRDMPNSVDLSGLSEQELKNYLPDILSS
jgi:hypothetical protein